MPAHLNIGRVKQASLCDHRDVEIANDPKLLGRSQRRTRDSTIDAVDPHSNESCYFLEDHVPAIKTGAANCILVRQDKRMPTFGWPANGISARGVKMRTR